MYFEQENSGTYNFIAGMLLGAVIGASIALLSAPTSGKRTRRKLVRAVDGARRSAEDQLDDWGEDVRTALRSSRRRLRI